MLVGLLCAVGTSLCYGVGSVLQGVAAQDTSPSESLDPRLLVRLLGAWRYVVGLVLDTVGFVLSLVALRTLPLYAVQSVVASSLAVAAVVAALILGSRLSRVERLALLGVVAGLAVVGLSAGAESATPLGTATQWSLVVAAVVLGACAVPAGRLDGPRAAGVLGAIAGLAFGVVAVAARALSPAADGSLGHLLHVLLVSPATYAVLLAAPLALVSYATALQRGGVVPATAPLVVGETVLPALVGLALLGDHPRPGWAVAAAAGFVVAVGAALALSRFGEVSAPADVPSPSP